MNDKYGIEFIVLTYVLERLTTYGEGLHEGGGKEMNV
jgi:hypothetical protein